MYTVTSVFPHKDFVLSKYKKFCRFVLIFLKKLYFQYRVHFLELKMLATSNRVNNLDVNILKS